MQNAYGIIIGLFILGGLASAVWGWTVIQRARKTLHWPHTNGVIEIAKAASEKDDLLPHIEFSFNVDGEAYRQTVKFPAGTMPSQELSNTYLEKFTIKRTVEVYYDPQDPQQATLEPGPARGDWLIFSLGVSASLLGIIMLLV